MRQSVQAIFASHVERLGPSEGWKIQAIQFFMRFSGRGDALFLWIPKRAIGIEKGACMDLSGCFFSHSPPRSDGWIRVRPGFETSTIRVRKGRLERGSKDELRVPKGGIPGSWGCSYGRPRSTDRSTWARIERSGCDLRIWGARVWTTQWRERC